jgi:hypothetical protein
LGEGDDWEGVVVGVVVGLVVGVELEGEGLVVGEVEAAVLKLEVVAK